MFTFLELAGQAILKRDIVGDIMDDWALKLALGCLAVLFVYMFLQWLFKFFKEHSAVLVPMLGVYAVLLTWVVFK